MMKSESYLQLFIIAATAFLFSSCLSYVPSGYYTMTQNVPMMKEKSEAQMNVTFGGSHVEAQGAYSPVQNVMVLGNTWQDIFLSDGFSNEGGIGYYHHDKDGHQLELIGMYTYSRQETEIKHGHHHRGLNPFDISYPQYFKAGYTGYSLQLNKGKHLSKKGMQIAFTVKYSLLHYSDFYYLISEGPYTEYSKYDQNGGFETNSVYSLKNKNQHMVDLAITYKIGGKNIKYMIQAAFHMNLDGDGFRQYIPPFYNPFIISNVLQLSFNVPKKKSEELLQP